jgi:hypothetical protein
MFVYVVVWELFIVSSEVLFMFIYVVVRDLFNG